MSNRFPTSKLPFRRPKVRDRESVMLKHFTYRKMGHIHSPIESGHAFLKKIASSVKFCCYYGLLLLTIFFRGKVHLHSPLPPPPGGRIASYTDVLVGGYPEEGTSLVGTKLNAISWQQNRADLFIKGQYIGLQN